MPNAEVSKREKARLREMQQLKKQKVQEILDAQNAAIDADMVSSSSGKVVCICYPSIMANFSFVYFYCRITGGRGA